jgi:endonuclease I
MKQVIFFTVFLLSTFFYLEAQPPGYYNGTAGLSGEGLKVKIHEIIDNHVDFSYSQAKFLINYSDADPENENNVILFYTQRSQNADNYGTGGDFINREHVWAKSHGDFSDKRPMDGDAYNLRPADASVNMDKSNKDFGIVQPNGTEHGEAAGNWYNGYAWEPGPDTKGQVARIMFYMDNRYEGTNGEIDLTVVNGFDTYPRPEHGDKAALLLWNNEYPPSDFERRRNERIFSIQQNRNPFVDNPQWVDMIWGDEPANPILIDNLEMTPKIPLSGQTPEISFTLNSELQIDAVNFYWGEVYNSEQNSIDLIAGEGYHSTNFSLDNFSDEQMVYFKIVVLAEDTQNTVHGSFLLPKNIGIESITPIHEIQGSGNSSPIINQIVTTSGRITANYDNTVYIQSGTGPYSGMCVFAPLKTGHVGDSVVITGRVVEYQQLTEVSNVQYFYNHKTPHVYDPIILKITDIDEKYEGMLVTIEDVIFDDGGTVVPDQNVSYKFSDGSGSMNVYFRYSSRMLNKTLPGGITNVTGILSQYGDEYQLLPRDIYDFSAGLDTVPPVVTNVTVLSSNWVQVDFNEKVEKESSENLNNYSISGGVNILSAFRYEEANAVLLNVEGLSEGTYTLSISDVKDGSGNAMEIQHIDFVSEASSINEMNAKDVKVYPNPAQKGFINVEFSRHINDIEITDLSGRVVLEAAVNNSKIQLPLKMQQGVYIMKINTGDSYSINKKIIVQ